MKVERRCGEAQHRTGPGWDGFADVRHFFFYTGWEGARGGALNTFEPGVPGSLPTRTLDRAPTFFLRWNCSASPETQRAHFF